MKKSILLALGVSLVAFSALGHTSPGGMDYDAWCCSGADCAPIPEKTVRVVQGGYQVTLRPGDHHMVTREHTFFVRQSDAKPATDGEYHVCLYPTEDTLRCFYTPPMGF